MKLLNLNIQERMRKDALKMIIRDSKVLYNITKILLKNIKNSKIIFEFFIFIKES